jgi:hypothetical protein
MRRFLLALLCASTLLGVSASGSSAMRDHAQSRTIATECWTRDSYDRYCHYDVYERVPGQSYYIRVAYGNGYLMHFTVPYNTDGWVQAIVLSSYCNGYGQIVNFPAYSGYQWVGLAIPCG